MAKPEWGSKRLCPSCGARFYDLLKNPAVCPQCSTKVKGDTMARYRRPAKPAADPAPAAKPEPKAEPEPKPKPQTDGGDDDAPETDDELESLGEELGEVDDLAADAEDDDVIEDASDLGEDDDDMSEVREHIDEDVADKA